MLGDLLRHQANAGASALDQHIFARLHATGGDDGVVHGVECGWQGGGLIPGNVGIWNFRCPAPIRDGILSPTLGAAAHDPVTNLEPAFGLGFRAKAGHFSDKLQADNRTRPTSTPMGHARGHHQIRPVETAGANADENFVRFRCRGWYVLDLDA